MANLQDNGTFDYQSLSTTALQNAVSKFHPSTPNYKGAQSELARRSQASSSYIPRHATNYDPQTDISKSLPSAKKVKGQAVPVTATYSPKHSSRNYTPAQQMRAKIAASRGAVYNPANPTPVNPAIFKGTKMGQVVTPGQKKPQQKQNLNQHQFGLKGAMHFYDKAIKPHEGRNKAILEGLAKNASR